MAGITSKFALNTPTVESGAMLRLFRMSPARREVPRVSIAIGGRIMLANRLEYAATAVEASARSMMLESEANAAVGERIVGYFFSLGRVEGTVSQLTPKGFTLELSSSALKRDKLAAQITWAANRDVFNLPEDRRHDRVVPRDPRIALRQLSNPGHGEIPCHLIDVSRSGAAVAVRGASLRKGEEIMLGTTPARVVRAFDGGIAVEFYASLPESMFCEDIRL